jgi:hypothetical protein
MAVFFLNMKCFPKADLNSLAVWPADLDMAYFRSLLGDVMAVETSFQLSILGFAEGDITSSSKGRRQLIEHFKEARRILHHVKKPRLNQGGNSGTATPSVFPHEYTVYVFQEPGKASRMKE